jgi:hypothetical protein
MPEPGDGFRRMIEAQSRMSLRDQIATTVISSMVKGKTNLKDLSDKDCKEMTDAAYRLADAAITSRSKTKDLS